MGKINSLKKIRKKEEAFFGKDLQFLRIAFFEPNSYKHFQKGFKIYQKLELIYSKCSKFKKEVFTNFKDEFKTHYEVLSKIKSSECNKLAPQLSNCNDSYLIKIGRHSVSSIGWIGSYYIFGFFEDKDADKYLVPLKLFNNINYALNFLNKL